VNKCDRIIRPDEEICFPVGAEFFHLRCFLDREVILNLTEDNYPMGKQSSGKC
jgi:hypothetical protein